MKRFIRVRVDLYRLSCPGICPEVTRLRTRHTGRLLSLTGTVTRVSAIKSQEVEQMMECTKCGYRFVVNRRAAGVNGKVSFRQLARQLTTLKNSAKTLPFVRVLVRAPSFAIIKS